MAVHATIPLQAVEGMHNVYFVFRNSKAKAKQPLMQVTSIEFQNKVAAPVAVNK